MKIINEFHGVFILLVQYLLTNWCEPRNQQHPSTQCQFEIISIFLGQNYNTLWTVCLMGISQIFWIISCHQVSQTISPSFSKCVLCVTYLAWTYRTVIIVQSFIRLISMIFLKFIQGRYFLQDKLLKKSHFVYFRNIFLA